MLGLRLWLAGSLLGSYAAGGPPGGPPGGIERRRRPKGASWLIPLLLVGIALDLVISAVLGFLTIQNRESARKAEAAVAAAAIAKVVAYDNCVADNARRQADTRLWHGVLELIDTPQNAGNPGVIRFVAQVNALVAIADRPQTCTRPIPDP